MIRLACILTLLASPLWAETLVAARTIPAQTLIGPDDLVLRDVDMVGGLSDPMMVIGKETRVALYAGRPVRAGDIGAPALIDRNQIVSLIYDSGGLMIATEGRAMSRAGAGEVVRIMNLASRTTVTARVGADGAAYVSQ